MSSTTPIIALISTVSIVLSCGEAKCSQSACTFALETTNQESVLLTWLQKQVLFSLYLLTLTIEKCSNKRQILSHNVFLCNGHLHSNYLDSTGHSVAVINRTVLTVCPLIQKVCGTLNPLYWNCVFLLTLFPLLPTGISKLKSKRSSDL